MCMYVHMYVCTSCVYMNVCMYVCMYVCVFYLQAALSCLPALPENNTHVFIACLLPVADELKKYVLSYLYVCMYVCMYVCIPYFQDRPREEYNYMYYIYA